MSTNVFIHFYCAVLLPLLFIGVAIETVCLLHGGEMAFVLAILLLWAPLALFAAYQNWQSGIELLRASKARP